MKETVTEFLNRAVADYMNVRVEANDILPIKGTKEEIIDKVNDLYFEKYVIINNLVVITASFYGC